MNSYEKYEEIRSFCITPDDPFGTILAKPLDSNEIEKMIENAKNSIYIVSGELRSFLDSQLINTIKRILSQNPNLNITIVCGNKVIAEKNNSNKLEHPFLQMLFENFKTKFDSFQYKLYYTTDNIMKQISNGYSHKIIIDAGYDIAIEKPHGYKSKSNEFIEIQRNYDYGRSLINNIEDYISIRDMDLVLDLDKSNIQYTSSLEFENIDEKMDISNKEDFCKKYLQMMEERFNNGGKTNTDKRS